MLDAKELGTRIRRLRLARGWARPRLAKRLGCTATSVRNWEEASTTPTLRFIRVLIDEFGAPLYATSGTRAIREIPNDILKFINTNCAWRGWTQSELARRLGVRRQAVNNLVARSYVANNMSWRLYVQLKKLFDAHPIVCAGTKGNVSC